MWEELWDGIVSFPSVTDGPVYPFLKEMWKETLSHLSSAFRRLEQLLSSTGETSWAKSNIHLQPRSRPPLAVLQLIWIMLQSTQMQFGTRPCSRSSQNVWQKLVKLGWPLKCVYTVLLQQFHEWPLTFSWPTVQISVCWNFRKSAVNVFKDEVGVWCVSLVRDTMDVSLKKKLLWASCEWLWSHRNLKNKCVCVCVCVRERERERETASYLLPPNISDTLLHWLPCYFINLPLKIVPDKCTHSVSSFLRKPGCLFG